jgi:hypothetical protein
VVIVVVVVAQLNFFFPFFQVALSVPTTVSVTVVLVKTHELITVPLDDSFGVKVLQSLMSFWSPLSITFNGSLGPDEDSTPAWGAVRNSSSTHLILSTIDVFFTHPVTIK